jgi:hypothetical protein
MKFEAQVTAERTRLAPLFAAAVEADRAVHTAWKEGAARLGVARYKETENYDRTLRDFHDVRLTIDDIVRAAMVETKRGNLSGLPTLVAYLDLPGRYFRSGYTRGNIWRLLKQIPLDNEQQTIIRQVILNQIVTAGPEFQAAVMVAARFWSPEFSHEVSAMRHSDREYVVRRVEQLLAVLDQR